MPRIEAAALYVHELRDLQGEGRHRRRGSVTAGSFPDVIRVQSVSYTHLTLPTSDLV